VPNSKGTRGQVHFGEVLIELQTPMCKNGRMAKLDSVDLKAIIDLIEVTVEEVVERKELVTKYDLSHLPTKDEFYGKMDEVIGELKPTREAFEHHVSAL
jgi:hypothetical protein